MDKLVLRSPAKLNLYLNVLRKRSDGYHDIETIFEKIALFDIITIRPNKKGIKITSDNPLIPSRQAGRANLAYRAAKAIFDKAGFKKGVWIDIKKNIPVAAGLGGGSSNAATVLLGLNSLFKLGVGKAELIKIGRVLGADVGFFLYDSNFAIGRGIGSEVLPLYSDINIWHVLICFGFGISTKGVYNDPSLRLTHKPFDVKMTARFVLKNDVENLGYWLYNKLEEAVLNKAALIGAAKRILFEEGAYGALLSGSGPTVFGITKTREEAVGLQRRIRGRIKCSKILVVRTFSQE